MWYYVKLTCWSVLWLIIWPLSLPFRSKERNHNCLTWAIEQIERNDGYLVIRWCRSSKLPWLKWPHFMYLPIQDQDKVIHFVPEKDEHVKKWYPRPWFKGYIKIGDPKGGNDEN